MHYKYKYPELFDNVPRTDFSKLSGNLIIYGAGFQGLLTAHLLSQKGINVCCFCDIDEKKQGSTYFELPVFTPKKIKQTYADATIIVTPYSLIPAYNYVKEELGYNSVITPYSLFLEFDSEDFDKLCDLPYWYHPDALDYHVDLFLRMCVNLLTEHTLFSADISVTEVCNLRCKDCMSLMPGYVSPKHFSLDEMIQCVDMIMEDRIFHHFNIEGGEALIWKHLPCFLKYLCSRENLMNIYLYTNGTIIPDQPLLEALKNSKIVVRISDYGKLSKIEELKRIFKENGIRYKVAAQKWYELVTLSSEPRNKAEVKKTTDCCCKTQPNGNGGPYMIDGKLFYCPLQGNLHNIGKYTSSPNDYVNLRVPDKNIQDRISEVLYKTHFPQICKYCRGRAYTGKEVEPAIQLRKNESFVVRFD